MELGFDMTLYGFSGFTGGSCALGTPLLAAGFGVVPPWLIGAAVLALVGVVALAVKFPAQRGALIGAGLVVLAFLAAALGQRRIAAGLQRNADIQRGKKEIKHIHKEREAAAREVEADVNASVAREDAVHDDLEAARTAVTDEAEKAEAEGRPEEPVDLPT